MDMARCDGYSIMMETNESSITSTIDIDTWLKSLYLLFLVDYHFLLFRFCIIIVTSVLVTP